MKNTPTSKKYLPFTSLLLVATHISCSPVNAMEPYAPAVPNPKASQQHQIHPRDQLLVDFIQKHAPHKFETTNQGRETLEGYARQIIWGDSKYDEESSGGPLGKEFFDLMHPAVSKEFCEKIKSLKASLPKESDVSEDVLKNTFNDLIEDLGDESYVLASIMGVSGHDLFGCRQFILPSPNLKDTFSKSKPWPQWYELLKNKVQEITADKDLVQLYDQVIDRESMSISLGHITLDIMRSNGDFNVYLRHSMDKNQKQAFSEKHFLRAGAQSAAYYWVLKNPARGSMTSFFPTNGGEVISCYRQSGRGIPTLLSQEIISHGLDNFKNLLYWDGTVVDDFIIGHYASLLWKMTHASIYRNGQTEITQWFLDSFAKIHGYELKLREQRDINFGNAPQDIQTLVELDREKFVHDCVAKGLIRLEKINDEMSENPPASSLARPGWPHVEEGPLMKIAPELAYRMLENTVPSGYDCFNKTSYLLTYRLVCKKWANMVNTHRKMAYHIPLNAKPDPGDKSVADPGKHFPPFFKGISSALDISHYEDAHMESLWRAIEKLKECTVEIVQWNGRSYAMNPAVPYPINKDNLNCIFKVMADSLNPEVLKTLDFRGVSLQESSQKFADLLVKFQKLEHLTLSCPNMTPEGMESILKVLPPSLISLDLTGSKSGVKGFKTLINKLPQFKNLKLLGIQTGDYTNRYGVELSFFHGQQKATSSSRKTHKPMKGYNGGGAKNRQIIQHNYTAGRDLMDRFKEAVEPFEKLEYIVLN